MAVQPPPPAWTVTSHLSSPGRVPGPPASLANCHRIWQPAVVRCVPRKGLSSAQVASTRLLLPGFWLKLPGPQPGTQRMLPAPRGGGGRRRVPRLGLPPLGRVPSCHRRPYSLPGAGSSVAGGTSLTAHLRRRAASCSPAPRAASGPSDDLSDNWLTALPSRSLTRGAMTSLRPAAPAAPPLRKSGFRRGARPRPLLAKTRNLKVGGGKPGRRRPFHPSLTQTVERLGGPQPKNGETERGELTRRARVRPGVQRSPRPRGSAGGAPDGGLRPGWRAAPSVQRASGLS